MRNAKLYLASAALLHVLAASGCGADHQYNPGPMGIESRGDGGGGDGGGGDGSGAVVTPLQELVNKSGLGDWLKSHPGSTGGSGGTSEIGGEGGSGGEGGGLPPEPPANDKCTGELVALSPGSTVEIQGTLIGAADDLTTFCADTSTDPGNPDVVYQLDVAEDISLRLRVVTTELDPALSLRRVACDVESNGDACLNFGSGAEATGVSLAAGTYWVVIDSADGNAGDFLLQLAATAPACGDGILNAGEQCDPGAGAPDDGCHDPGSTWECTLGEEPSAAVPSACPGAGPFAVGMSADPLNPTITRLGPHHSGNGGHSETNETTADWWVCGWAAEGGESVFHVIPQESGTLFARIGYDDNGAVVCDLDPDCGDFILYMRQGSCEKDLSADPPQQLACADFDDGFQEILVIQAPVTAGSDYWVFVDGLDDVWGLGSFHLELWLVP